MKSFFGRIFYPDKKIKNSESEIIVKKHSLKKYPETFLLLSELGASYPPYQPTYDFGSNFINEHHKFYSHCPVNEENKITIKLDIPGWLRQADALKLYELAYFCEGDIVELGTYRGLSTSIIAKACDDAKKQNKIFTVDRSRILSWIAKRKVSSSIGTKRVDFSVGDATKFLDKMIKKERKFGFAFIDHSHEYEPVYQACLRLDKLVKPGSFCLFHDYNDSRNNKPNKKDYGVYQAVSEGLSKNKFEFFGIFGCCGLFKRN